jgi:hypothetical protein
MNWHVIVRGGISQAIGRCGLSRPGVVRTLAALHIDLPTHADVLRLNRDPIDMDFFLYRVGLWDGGAFHTFEFRVNDGTAPGFLFVVRMKHIV